MNYPKVSIIIPVYKVEAYIEKCVRSLFGQTLDDLEYIFVDDCSPDRSIEIVENILKEFPERQNQVKIIRHTANQGVSQSRQDGLDATTGEYVIHCDPDDWVDIKMYEKLYKKAIENSADIVICDFNLIEDQILYRSQKLKDYKSIKILEHIVGISSPFLLGTTWNKLIKRDLAKTSSFEANIQFCEDVLYLFNILNQDLKIVSVDEALYNYSRNSNSLVHKFNISTYKSDLHLIKQINHLKEKSTSLPYVNCCNRLIGGIIVDRLLFYDLEYIKKLTKNLKSYLPIINQYSPSKYRYLNKLFVLWAFKGYPYIAKKSSSLFLNFIKLTHIIRNKYN